MSSDDFIQKRLASRREERERLQVALQAYADGALGEMEQARIVSLLAERPELNDVVERYKQQAATMRAVLSGQKQQQCLDDLRRARIRAAAAEARHDQVRVGQDGGRWSGLAAAALVLCSVGVGSYLLWPTQHYYLLPGQGTPQVAEAAEDWEAGNVPSSQGRYGRSELEDYGLAWDYQKSTATGESADDGAVAQGGQSPNYLYAFEGSLQGKASSSPYKDFSDADLRKRELSAIGDTAKGVAFQLHAKLDNIEDDLEAFRPSTKTAHATTWKADSAADPQTGLRRSRELVEVEADIDSEAVVGRLVVTELDIPVEELETEDEVVADVPVKGREEARAVSEMGGPAALMSIGGGGGGGGGERDKGVDTTRVDNAIVGFQAKAHTWGFDGDRARIQANGRRSVDGKPKPPAPPAPPASSTRYREDPSEPAPVAKKTKELSAEADQLRNGYNRADIERTRRSGDKEKAERMLWHRLNQAGQGQQAQADDQALLLEVEKVAEGLVVRERTRQEWWRGQYWSPDTSKAEGSYALEGKQSILGLAGGDDGESYKRNFYAERSTGNEDLSNTSKAVEALAKADIQDYLKGPVATNMRWADSNGGAVYTPDGLHGQGGKVTKYVPLQLLDGQYSLHFQRLHNSLSGKKEVNYRQKDRDEGREQVANKEDDEVVVFYQAPLAKGKVLPPSDGGLPVNKPAIVTLVPEQAEQKVARVITKAPPVNPWVLTADDALSTFAIDTDKASYRIARNFIRRGYLPPAATVRMEEFVNAFDYQYPRNDRQTFTVHSQAAQAPFAARSDPDTVLVSIGVRGKVMGRDQQKASHIVLVIDGSGSMNQVDRLPLMQRALEKMIDGLDKRDHVTVISYGGGEHLLAEHVPAQQKQRLLKTIQDMQAGGATNLAAGLRLGYQKALQHYRADRLSQVVICSDGIANVGTTDAEALLAEVTKNRQQGISTFSVGFGTGAYNDALLEQLANKGDGHYVFIDDAKRADGLAAELSAARHVIARDAKIQVAFDPDRVRRWRQVGYENRAIADKDFRNDRIDAGEVGSGQSATALYEVELHDANDRLADLGTVFVRYHDPAVAKVVEERYAVSGELSSRTTPQSHPRFYLAACAAEFAELLRGSEHAQDGSLRSLLHVLEQVRAALPHDDAVRDLHDLVKRARGLPRAQ